MRATSLPKAQQSYLSPAASDWRSTPTSVRSNVKVQTIRVNIDYSVKPSWVLDVTKQADRAGSATLAIGNDRFSINIKKGQSAGTTARLFRQKLVAAGYQVRVSGQERPTAAKLKQLKTELASKTAQLRTLPRGGVEAFRVKTEIEVLQSQIANPGRFMVVLAPKG